MPKFTDKEKAIIYTQLRNAGENLFVRHGLKKVTVDDIAASVGIGKGTFYHFYANKEHLFMDIFNHTQKEIYTGVDLLLVSDEAGKEKALRVFQYLLKKYEEHPLMAMVSGDMFELLQCKVPKECLSQNDMDDLELFQKAAASGIRFRYPPNIVIKAAQSIFVAAHTLRTDQDGRQVIELLVRAVIDTAVE